MSSFASASRVSVACFLAIFVLLKAHGDMAAMFYAPTPGSGAAWSGVVSHKNMAHHDNPEFSWDLLTPGKKLDWHECFPDRQCARLIVPLNYSDPQGAEAIIALIRKPSSLPSSSPEYKGPILFNPGGPGESGVDLIRQLGNAFSLGLGPQFDIVGFDPRGIGQSTPRVALFKTAAERAIWDASELHIPEDDVANTWARALVHGQLAKDRDDGYLRHINTDHTARDMLRIVEAHGRTKIQYWGFSYGSVLGAVFASMFPNNIERLVIDGVADSENYFATLLSNNLLDMNKVMESFYTECANAGPDRCAFWAPSPDNIRQNLTNLYSDSIRVQPVPVKTGDTYGYVDHNILHSLVFSSLYSPFAMFPLLAKGLAELADGDEDSKGLEQNAAEKAAILCNDGLDIPGRDGPSINQSEVFWVRVEVAQFCDDEAGPLKEFLFLTPSCSRTWPYYIINGEDGGGCGRRGEWGVGEVGLADPDNGVVLL